MFQKEWLTCENAKLLLSSAGSRAFCNTFVFTPPKGKEGLGDLAILIQMDEKTRENQEISQGIVEVIKSEYYRDPLKTPAENLEASLIKANEILRELASLGKVSWIGKINAVIASVTWGNLILAQIGETSSLLIRDGEANIIPSQYREQGETRGAKIFSGITSGKLESGDYLILSTATLLDFFSPEKLIHILTQQNLSQARNYIQSLLSEQIEKETVGTILFSLKRAEEKKEEVITEIKEEREESRAPEQIATVEAITKRIKARQRKKFPYFILAAAAHLLLFLGHKIAKIFSLLKKHFLPFLKRVVILGVFFAKKALSSLILLVQKRIKKKERKIYSASESPASLGKKEKIKKLYAPIFSKLKALPSRVVSRGKKVIARFTLPSPSGKVIHAGHLALASSLVLLVIFVFTTTLIKKKEKSQEGQLAKPEILEEAQNKRKAAMDAMIYQDEGKARALLAEADQLVGQVLGSSYPKQEEAQELKQAIEEQFDKINKTTHPTSLTLVANVEKLNPELVPRGLIPVGRDLYTFCSQNNVILRADLTKKEMVQVSPNFVNIGILNKAVALDQNKNILFANQEGEFALFDLAGFKIEKINAPPPFVPNNIQALAEYDNKIYTLNPDQNQIAKYNRSLSGLSHGAAWLKNGNIENGISLAIDGNVYVLEKSGKILKFYAGEPRDFATEEISPPLTSPNKIFTKTEYKNLYLLDPPTKRVVVLEKDSGKVLSQFISDDFVDLKDLWVSPDEKIIYVLAGKAIWEFENKSN